MQLQKDYLALDLETTGLDAGKDKIIEIGAVKVRGGRITADFQTFVNPGRTLDGRITELTGITNADLRNAPYIQEVIDDFLAFAGEDVLLGHALMFDYSFLKRSVINYSHCTVFDRKGIDTLAIARKYLSSLESRRLGALCSYYKIELKPHRALEDARAAHELYLRMAEQFLLPLQMQDTEQAKECEAAFSAKVLNYKVKKEAPVMKKQIEWLRKAFEVYQITPDYEVEQLTKNEASRIMDSIISTYGKLH